ncbi:related to uridine ribohydrolase [Cephalotrichum gorgonifer]|uniref:Related to uridine ribohydrolase n=1 Tax=Cephalotrichum gorgonifer TaxID=2041049 RepID=A0AAE8MQ85_9PEZI|nr:related to uridine ribohydrolase [Cephalotrichum gorgonifer]
MSTQQVPVWLDCDPGHDDAFAILLAAYHPAMRLLGISTVFGNASLPKTTNNASSLLTAIGKDKEITIYPGAAKSLERPAVHAADIHGESGIDGTDLLPPGLAKIDRTTPATRAMATALLAEPQGTAWLVATGSLTNVAALFNEYPQLAEHIAGLSIMGGAVGGGFSKAVMGMVDGVPRIGNWSQYAEFNIFIDPEAANRVFGDEVLSAKTTLVPLDLSHQVLATESVQQMLLHGRGKSGSVDGEGKPPLRRMLVELLMFFMKTYRDVFGISEGPPLHDPIAVAAVLVGSKYEIPFYDWEIEAGDSSVKERFSVTVVADGHLDDAKTKGSEIGRTVVTPKEPGSPGVRIPRGLDVDAFWNAIEDCLEEAEKAVSKGGE